MGNCNGANHRYYGSFGTLVDRHTDLCLEATHNHKGGVYTHKCNASLYQEWDMPHTSIGFYYYYHKNVGTYQCLVGGHTGAVYMPACRQPNDTKQ
jgi:hypothetical protein